ncbi:hypothetical protein BGZ61DRAFT_103337 [Ilyonectria robusta]|uniref:uncharacterized protein n=1 Tax=Ilyonectria robusta TaxID=1079257 RepID=UPI001E8EBAD4|nr:uncharacterized protein BGZ61DRAFT_103337 [Ilyonectria robusta]KAH8673104.1 hypothetical protein BGZ61DRAFT_103337 [Ilyonectria robusta]
MVCSSPSSPFPLPPGCAPPHAMLCCAVRCVVLPPAVFACNPLPAARRREGKTTALFCSIPFHFVWRRSGGRVRHTRMRRDVFRCGLPSLWSGDDDAGWVVGNWARTELVSAARSLVAGGARRETRWHETGRTGRGETRQDKTRQGRTDGLNRQRESGRRGERQRIGLLSRGPVRSWRWRVGCFGQVSEWVSESILRCA